MAEEGSDLHHLHGRVAGGAKAKGLVEGGGKDEGLVVPEADGVGHRRVPLREEVLELVRLEDVADRLVTAVLGPSATLPSLYTHLLPLHLLDQSLGVGPCSFHSTVLSRQIK